MTIWVALYGWAVLRNEVSETVARSFMWKVFKIGLVLAFALQSGFYISNVVRHRQRTGNGRGDDLPARRRRPGDGRPRPTRCSTSSTTTPARRSPTS